MNPASAVGGRAIETGAFMKLQRSMKGCYFATVMIFSWQLAAFVAILKSFVGWCLVDNSYSSLRRSLAGYSGAWRALRSSKRS